MRRVRVTGDGRGIRHAPCMRILHIIWGQVRIALPKTLAIMMATIVGGLKPCGLLVGRMRLRISSGLLLVAKWRLLKAMGWLLVPVLSLRIGWIKQVRLLGVTVVAVCVCICRIASIVACALPLRRNCGIKEI